MFEKNCLKGRSGIITGGSSGIGLGLAAYLSEHGAGLTLTGRSSEKLEAAVASLSGEIALAAGDVRRPEDVERGLQTHLARFGKVDFLINNAAGNFLCPLENMSPNAFQSVMNIVVNGTFLWSKAVQPHMKARAYGRIINIGTTYSWAHGANVAHSGAAKAAVLNLTKTMAVEWGPMGILTNLIAPGPVKETEGLRRLMPDEKHMAAFQRLMPVPRFAERREIAALALFLLSPMAGYINGAAIPVDGGLHLSIPGLLPVGTPIDGALKR